MDTYIYKFSNIALYNFFFNILQQGATVVVHVHTFNFGTLSFWMHAGSQFGV